LKLLLPSDVTTTDHRHWNFYWPPRLIIAASLVHQHYNAEASTDRQLYKFEVSDQSVFELRCDSIPHGHIPHTPGLLLPHMAHSGLVCPREEGMVVLQQVREQPGQGTLPRVGDKPTARHKSSNPSYDSCEAADNLLAVTTVTLWNGLSLKFQSMSTDSFISTPFSRGII